MVMGVKVVPLSNMYRVLILPVWVPRRMPLIPSPNGAQALIDEIILSLFNRHDDKGRSASSKMRLNLLVGSLVANKDDLNRG